MSRRTYCPAAVNDAVVLGAVASANDTGPGPLATLQSAVSAPPAGSPSSVTVPDRDADAGSVTDLSGPASTTGAAFGAGPPPPTV